MIPLIFVKVIVVNLFPILPLVNLLICSYLKALFECSLFSLEHCMRFFESHEGNKNGDMLTVWMSRLWMFRMFWMIVCIYRFLRNPLFFYMFVRFFFFEYFRIDFVCSWFTCLTFRWFTYAVYIFFLLLVFCLLVPHLFIERKRNKNKNCSWLINAKFNT